MLRLSLIITGVLTALLLPVGNAVQAQSVPLTWRYKHFLFPVSTAMMRDWHGEEEVWTYQGEEVVPPAALRAEGDVQPPLPDGFSRQMIPSWNRLAIEHTLRATVIPVLEREAGAVTISRTGSGTIAFDGVGLPGQRLRMDDAIDLTIAAVEQGIGNVELPISITDPSITVTDAQLRNNGITQLVSVGESDFRGSPVNRVHNIGVGLRRFNGHLIPQGDIFSFNAVLGPVNAATGYRKELTIKGDKTLPDYGGGLCQVSTTAYRGVWEYGFPIEQRRNHSYSVHYYSPLGTDATIYPPDTDIRFRNDSPGALLIQTYEEDGFAYFLYYGTRDDRRASLAGPFTWGSEAPPPPRTEYTTELAPGEKRKVGEAVPGIKAAWFRIVASGTGETIDPSYSFYEARPLFYQIGVSPDQLQPEPAETPLPPPEEAFSSSVAPAPSSRYPVVPRYRRRR